MEKIYLIIDQLTLKFVRPSDLNDNFIGSLACKSFTSDFLRIKFCLWISMLNALLPKKLQVWFILKI